MELAQDRVQWQALELVALNSRIHWRALISAMLKLRVQWWALISAVLKLRVQWWALISAVLELRVLLPQSHVVPQALPQTAARFLSFGALVSWESLCCSN
jgi:hypothetical protein